MTGELRKLHHGALGDL